MDDEKYYKVRDHCHYTCKYRGAAHDICKLRCNIPKEILVIFQNGSNHDYYFILKQSLEEFEAKFNCLGKNKKYITLSILIIKKIKKKLVKGKEIKDKIICYKLEFIDSARFLASALSNLIGNRAKKFIKINANTDMIKK